MKYLDLLGYEVTDCVTGFKGVVECMSYDLYGCIQAAVRPPIDKDGLIHDSRWLDCKRLTKTGDQPVMPVPCFLEEPSAEDEQPTIRRGEPGAAEKPAR